MFEIGRFACADVCVTLFDQLFSVLVVEMETVTLVIIIIRFCV